MGTTTTTTTNRVGAAFASALAVIMLVGACTTGGTSGGGSDASTPTPPVTSGPATTPPPAAESPVTELGVDCAGLLAPATATAFDASWAPRDHYDRDGITPSDYAIAQEGGLSCTWNDGASSDGKNNPTEGSAYSGLLVQALPHATGEWPQFVEIYGDDPDGRCFGDTTFRGCTFDQLIDDTWVSISATNFEPSVEATPEQRFATIVAEVTEVVSSADVADAPWPLGGPARPWSCVAGAALEREALGGGDELFVLTPGGGWSVYAAAWSRAVATSCSILAGTTPYSDESVLTGGAWALDQRIDFGLVDPETAVTVAGLADGDRAYRSCSAVRCVTDLVLGDDWVRLAVDRATVPDTEAASDRLVEGYVARAEASA
ncbi:hypothetical protein [Frigoribacterium sp. VKM Ac-2836]|uniref:hypothetical protein n=1 Tax=Frigoribacterium sp. VKM Ac-2836 TaxID=2739014 RepID=UPI0015649289|nr:hypothetical protein [Frigoribacterium sp. VKM Ac-2836]NRD27930.1 hypothetical protein [Frigoribacterium sp. VKM Ac-2836]